MEFLGKQIPDPPADCANALLCLDAVRKIEPFASLTPKTIQASMPEDLAPLGNPLGPLIGFMGRISNATIISLEESVSAAERCEGCALTCASDIRRNDGRA